MLYFSKKSEKYFLNQKLSVIFAQLKRKNNILIIYGI